jgi:signal transduction histidine kinase
VVKGARIEREAQQHYFQYTLELIPVGVLSFNKDDGAIEIYNAAASELMGMSRPSYIDELNRVKQGLAGVLRGMASEASELIELDSPSGRQRLVVRARMFTLSGREIKLLSFQNIRHELDREEQEAWQKLISVLRHEVMNSMGPVNSLSRTLLRMFGKDGRNKRVAELTDKTINDAVDGLQSIDNRTRGMMRFVQSYRELTRLPAPRKRHVGGAEVLKDVKSLMAEEMKHKGIELLVEEGDGMPVVELDDRQIHQVLINLVKNAAEAFEEGQTDKKIVLRGRIDQQGRACLEVQDNGPGMSPELQEKIFVPFYTTKKDGSGIGLNLARQIMLQHRGRIGLFSTLGEGTTFRLEF